MNAPGVRTHPVPFYAYLSLLLISESQHYRLASESWRDWEFVERFGFDNKLPTKAMTSIATLVNRKTGAAFLPDELDYIHWQLQRFVALDSEARQLRGRVDDFVAENTSLREMFRTDGLTSELHDVRERVERLLGRINTAAVLPFKKVAA